MKANKDRLYKDVEFLTTLQPARNAYQPESLEKVVEYVKDEFTAMGASPAEQSWEAGGTTYKNVIACYNKGTSRRLVLGAHYDVYGEQPGADDNASAVAGLLETARMVFSQKPQLDYCIEFVAYCLEEPPYFATEYMGSYVHAKSLKDAEADVIGMICYEMIGYFTNTPQPYPSPELKNIYPPNGDFITVIGIKDHHQFNLHVHALMSKNTEVDVQVISFPSHGDYAGLSDQRNYWLFGYPALMINDTAFLRNPNYHRVTDTIDTLDFEKMAAVVDGGYRVVTGILG